MADSSSLRFFIRWPFCSRFSPFVFVLFLFLFLLLFQVDVARELLPPQFRDWQTQVSQYLSTMGTTSSSLTPPLSSPGPQPLPEASASPPPLSSSGLQTLPETSALSPSRPPLSSPGQQPLLEPSALSPSQPALSSSVPQPPPEPSALPPPLPPLPSPPPPPPSSALHDTESGSHADFPRVAICIVGGARAFELTGPSIKKYLLHSTTYNADVFLHAPLDQDSYKLSILKDVPNLVHFRIFYPRKLPQTKAAAAVLTSSGSPKGIQGLLQYFSLVEGCLDMIRHYQSKNKFVYDWVIRTRLDGYWSDYLPPLSDLESGSYTVPLGSQFGGLNDRLGVGSWESSKIALSRLSPLPVLHAHGLRGLNSETSFWQNLRIHKVKYSVKEFPFCVLSRRTYGWPPGHRGVPVLSISSKGPLNGAKCRPCRPAVTGAAARKILFSLDRSWGWIGKPSGPEVCKPTRDWETDWPNVFDTVAEPEFTRVRRAMLNQTLATCIEAHEALMKEVQIWDAPSPAVTCERGLKPS